MKPENVFLTVSRGRPDSGQGMDFGISKHRSPRDDGNLRLTADRRGDRHARSTWRPSRRWARRGRSPGRHLRGRRDALRAARRAAAVPRAELRGRWRRSTSANAPPPRARRSRARTSTRGGRGGGTGRSRRTRSAGSRPPATWRGRFTSAALDGGELELRTAGPRRRRSFALRIEIAGIEVAGGGGTRGGRARGHSETVARACRRGLLRRSPSTGWGSCR